MLKKLFLHGTLLSLTVVTLVPLWIMFVTSFLETSGSLGVQTIFPDLGNLTLKNFYDVWTEGNFGRYFWNSLLVTVVITFANLLFDGMAAYALARRHFKGRKWLMGLILLKLMIPATVLMVPTFILVRNLGIYDSYWALILPMVAETFGIFLLRQYMLSLPVELEEAARLEGAGDWRIFFTIIMPLSKPALAVVAIHSVLVSWNAYIYPLILTSSDHMRTLPLGIAFYRASHSDVDTAHLMAGSVIASLPVILAFLIFQRQIIAGLTKGAVKG
ncbi:MAG: ABC transporter permease [SAR324 cluster bacterium]|uniref:ABC transporter permease n=1 Tax=SAR324 cluster bacterium TaxID=2024889 RepID=A0A2A4T4H1_9DELT|nr:MAG: ABC transporter permease [SAR324 cluster bacterium]